MYDYSTILDRTNVGSVKWDELKEYNLEGRGIVPLSNAEMEFPNAPEIQEGLKQFIDNTVLSYFHPTQSFFDAVKDWFGRRHGLMMTDADILPNHNIHVATSLVVAAFTEPGDGVLLMEPVWPGFFGGITNQSRKLVSSDLINVDGRYEIDYEDFENKARDPKNKILLFCSPHNPTGRVWTREELLRVADICRRNNVLMVVDELHCDIIMPGYKHIPMASLSEDIRQNSVTFVGCSKAFNIAGLDTSAIIIYNEELRKKYIKTRNAWGLVRPNMLGVKAMELALQKGEAWLDGAVKVIAQNADYVESYIRENMPLITCTHLEGTYLMWLDMRRLNLDMHEMEISLMRDAKLFMDDGYFFGDGGSGNGFERMNIAVPSQVIVDAMNRMHEWYLEHLNKA